MVLKKAYLPWLDGYRWTHWASGDTEDEAIQAAKKLVEQQPNAVYRVVFITCVVRQRPVEVVVDREWD
jgi:hypothetical protein